MSAPRKRVSASRQRRRGRRYRIPRVTLELAKHVEHFVKLHLPNGKRVGNDWRCGSVAGEPGQSLSICLAGEKAGLWYDHATGERGDILALVQAVLGFENRSQSARWAASWLEEKRLKSPLNAGRAPRVGTSESSIRSLSRRVEIAWSILAETTSSSGTLVESYLGYLGNRGITTECPETLRFHPALRHHESGDFWPALVCTAIKWPEETASGVHAVFLDPITGEKAPFVNGGVKPVQ